MAWKAASHNGWRFGLFRNSGCVATDQPGKFDKMVKSNCSKAHVFVSGSGPQYEGAAAPDRRTLGGWHSRLVLETL